VVWRDVDQRAYEIRLSIQKLGFTASQNAAALRMQHLWRARVARRLLKLILRAHHLMSAAEAMYESSPENIAALCNYSLYLHVGLHDMDKAAVLYNECLDRMRARGGDNAFVLYSYAIFVARTNGEYMGYVARARDAEQRYNKRSITNEAIYEVANAYYRQVAISQQSVSAWHNYALCR